MAKEEKETTNNEEKKVEKVETKGENNKNKTISGLDYKVEVLLVYLFPILGLVFSLLKDKDICDALRFHYNQSGTLFIVLAAGWIICIVPFLGLLAYELCGIALFVFSIIAVVNEYKYDKVYSIPVVSDLSKKIFKK